MPIETANDLIINAFYLINEYAPNEYPADYEIRQGLDLLNDYLAHLSGNNIFIPYTKDITFTMTPNKNTYKFSKLSTADVNTDKFVEIFDIYLIIDNVQYPLEVIPHELIYQTSRCLDGTSRPEKVFMQNDNQETRLTFVDSPDMSYLCVVRVKSILNDLDLFTYITSIPRHFFRFLRYSLAKELSSIFETNNWDTNKQKELDDMYRNIISGNDFDTSLNLTNTLLKPVYALG